MDDLLSSFIIKRLEGGQFLYPHKFIGHFSRRPFFQEAIFPDLSSDRDSNDDCKSHLILIIMSPKKCTSMFLTGFLFLLRRIYQIKIIKVIIPSIKNA